MTSSLVADGGLRRGALRVLGMARQVAQEYALVCETIKVASSHTVAQVHGLLQQAKRTARVLQANQNMMAIANLRVTTLSHLAGNLFAAAAAR